jgi:hypothetical protein
MDVVRDVVKSSLAKPTKIRGVQSTAGDVWETLQDGAYDEHREASAEELRDKFNDLNYCLIPTLVSTTHTKRWLIVVHHPCCSPSYASVCSSGVESTSSYPSSRTLGPFRPKIEGRDWTLPLYSLHDL